MPIEIFQILASGMILAVHIADAVLRPEWWIGGWIMAGLLVATSLYRLPAENLPRLAMMTAIFFMASSVHFPIGVGRVHLLLTGLVGVIAGYRSALVILAGLFLQYRLVGHGGLLALGFNTLAMAIPAMIVAWIFRMAFRKRRQSLTNMSWFGLFAGAIGVALTVGFGYVGLYFGAAPEWRSVTWVFAAVHVPVMIAEGILTAVILRHLSLAGYSFSTFNGITSSNGTSH